MRRPCVWEWIWEDYRWSPSPGDRVVRGGAWNSLSGDCKSSSRAFAGHSTRQHNIGFRVARTRIGQANPEFEFIPPSAIVIGVMRRVSASQAGCLASDMIWGSGSSIPFDRVVLFATLQPNSNKQDSAKIFVNNLGYTTIPFDAWRGQEECTFSNEKYRGFTLYRKVVVKTGADRFAAKLNDSSIVFGDEAAVRSSIDAFSDQLSIHDAAWDSVRNSSADVCIAAREAYFGMWAPNVIGEIPNEFRQVLPKGYLTAMSNAKLGRAQIHEQNNKVVSTLELEWKTAAEARDATRLFEDLVSAISKNTQIQDAFREDLNRTPILKRWKASRDPKLSVSQNGNWVVLSISQELDAVPLGNAPAPAPVPPEAGRRAEPAPVPPVENAPKPEN